MLTFQYSRFASLIVLPVVLATGSSADEPTRAQVEFFEARIRPVLVEHCYVCHNSETSEGGLSLDHQQALLKGGDGGPIVVPGNPDESRLLPILRHEIEGLEMPQEGPPLGDPVIADFEAWIRDGAADPRAEPPRPDDVAAATSWAAQFERRRQWWSFQPIQHPDPPELPGVAHPVDRFIRRELAARHLRPSGPAERHVLVRRLYYAIIGLPPTAAEATHWTTTIADADDDKRPAVIEQLIDDLLASPHFGERWARHWMDWIRYAESHGSEGDPAIDNAWLYRDYLIRALNDDVPVNQLLREHVAGDLLTEPRVNHDLGINESAIGPVHWRMVFHGFSPTDAMEERVRFTDDQINAFSRAFLGLTVSCARCHDHKFDAISQQDYYALYGILATCRPGRTVIDLPERVDQSHEALRRKKREIREALADAWLAAAANVRNTAAAAEVGVENPPALLRPIIAIQHDTAAGQSFPSAWTKQVEAFRRQSPAWDRRAENAARHWNLSREEDYSQWYRSGNGLPSAPQPAGTFAVAADELKAVEGVYPAGIVTHSLSTKDAARLTSPDFPVGPDQELRLYAMGANGATVRFVVQDYPRSGTVYPVQPVGDFWGWRRFEKLSYWEGDNVHLELTTARDAPLLVKHEDRSWFGIRDAMIVNVGTAVPDGSHEPLRPIMELAQATPPNSPAELAELYQTAVVSAVRAWQDETVSDEQALLLDACLRTGLLPNTVAELPAAAPLLKEYRSLEAAIPVPTRVPGLEETQPRDQPLFTRGDHHRPTDEVPRRFLEAIDATPYTTTDGQSGRRELARDLLRDDNPLTRRVIVNRIWHHLFGEGIVRSPDNFGRLGDQPSHPELLDYLATRFTGDGWSLKSAVRLLVTSQTWQQESAPSADAVNQDPDNRLLSHAHVRRLEAEAIRDSLLAVSGRLDRTRSGAPEDGTSNRRSIYVRVIRNSLDPFLSAFDFPEPYTSTGRRAATNVPAQSLTMMNDTAIIAAARDWAERTLREHSSEHAQIHAMFQSAFGRPASAEELQRAIDHLAATRRDWRRRLDQAAELRRQLDERERQLEGIVEPVRRDMLNSKSPRMTVIESLRRPLLEWDFMRSEPPEFETPLKLRKGAKLTKNGLELSGRGFAISAPLNRPLEEKTLSAWVQLDNLDQRGGGVMTVQSTNGDVFDAIVFGEQEPQHWVAGSDFFHRTESFNGHAETDAAMRPIHLAIAWHVDGRIAGYRDGRIYGTPYVSSGLRTFAADETLVGFGIRHLPAAPGKQLAGRILKAQLFDRALNEDEVAAIAGMIPFVSLDDVLTELSSSERQTAERLRDEIDHTRTALKEFSRIPNEMDDALVWTDLARTLLMSQEFVYLR